MKQVSLSAGASVSGESAASRKGTAGRNRGAASSAATPEPRRAFSKGPTAEQWTYMSGCMYNALERLRGVSVDWRRRADANEGWLQPGHLEKVLAEIDAVSNLLRVGLKARLQKERPTALQQEKFGL